MSQAKLNFSRTEFEQRLLKTRQEMQRRGVDLLIVSYWSIMNWQIGHDGWSFYVHQCAILPLEGASIQYVRGLDAYGALHVCFIEPSDIIVYRDHYVQTTKVQTTKANSASAALNKWLKVHVSKDIVVHSLRHAMRDRLRAVECPADIIDQIGGWSKKGVGESYGRGYQVEQLWGWLAKVLGQGEEQRRLFDCSFAVLHCTN